jgi:hypothetical protein
MKKSTFTKRHILAIPAQHRKGQQAIDICRELISRCNY